MRHNKFYPWIVVALLWVVALLNYMDRQMLSTMQEAMKADIVELNKAEAFGALMAVFLWIYGIVSPFAGVVADRVSRKWLVVGSLFVWSAVTYLMGYATDFTQLYWLRALMGISEALYIPSALSLIADWHEGKSRSLAIGIHMTGLYVGQVLALCLMDKRKEQSKVAGPEMQTPKESIWRGLAVVFSTWAFWVILIYFAVPSLPGWATKNWLPTLFATNLGIPMSEAGPMSTITIAASSFIGVIVGGILSDNWVKRNIRGRIYTSAIGLGMTIPALVLLGFGHSVIAIVGAGLFFGMGFGMFDANNMPILCQIIPARYRATAYGVMNMVGVFAGAAVTHILGKWTDGGNLGLGFAILGCIVLLALVLQLSCLRPTTDNME